MNMFGEIINAILLERKRQNVCVITATALIQDLTNMFSVNILSMKTETGVCECGEKYTRPHTHAFGDYMYNNDADCVTDGTMTAVCTGRNCGLTDTVNDPNHKASGHYFGEWKYNHNAKLFANGTETRFCHCGYSETQEKTRSAKIIVICDAILNFINNLFK